MVYPFTLVIYDYSYCYIKSNTFSLVDVLKENIQPLFKHIIRISISYIW